MIMKKTILLLLAILFTAPALFPRVIVVTVGPNGTRTFDPANITNAVVGDTIRWVWSSGTHNTTSTTIPSGATSWASPIDGTNQTFNYKITVPGTYNYVCTFHAAMGMTGSFIAAPNAIQQTGTVVNDYALSQNYPNPFNPSTSIKFAIPVKSQVKISIYNVAGVLVSQPVNENLNEGEYKYEFNASGLSSGVYFYKIEAGKFSQVKHMVLLK